MAAPVAFPSDSHADPLADSLADPFAPPSPRRVPLRGHSSLAAPVGSSPTTDELRQVCRGLLDALDEELRATSADAVAVGEGHRVEVVGDGAVYRIATPAQLDATAGDLCLLRVGSRQVDGVVRAAGAGTIELRLSDDVGPTVPAGSTLLLDAPWLVSRLRTRIREAFEVGLRTPALFNLPMALRALGIGEIEVAPRGPALQYENARRPLNEEQEHALEVAFRASLSVVASPGGTGKTLTLGALVETAYRAGLRVLVTAPSNVAVDLVMQQIGARLAGEPGFGSAEVLRVGSDAGAELRRDHGPNVVLDEVAARLRPHLWKRIHELEHRAESLARALTAARRAAGGLPCPEVDALDQQLRDTRAALREQRQRARDYTRRLVSGARVVGATLARAYLDSYLHTFDMVIVDEASMAPGPAVFVAAGLARRHVVIAGDPYQLAVPVRSTGVNRHWLAVDTFERLDIVHAMRHEESVPYLTQLGEQRRSAEPICELLRTVWYGPALRTAREVTARERARNNCIFDGAALCYLDTARLNARAHRPWGRTWANDEHAKLIADLVAYLDSAGEVPPAGATACELLVLSPYRGQVAAIRQALGSAWLSRGVDVRTVHRAQGAEATTVIFDLTLSRDQPTHKSPILTATRPEQEGSRLLAVAASRARSRFILVGDLTWLERSVAPESALGRMYGHLREHAHGIPIEELRPALRRPLYVVR